MSEANPAGARRGSWVSSASSASTWRSRRLRGTACEAPATVTYLASVPRQSRERPRLDRLLHRRHGALRDPLRPGRPRARPAPRASTSASPRTRPLRGRRSRSSRPSPGRRRRATSCAIATASTALSSAGECIDGHRGSAHRAAEPVAVALRRAGDRQHPPRVSRQRRRPAPAPPPPRPHGVLRPLPSLALPPRARHGLPGAAADPVARAGRVVEVAEGGGLYRHYERWAA